MWVSRLVVYFRDSKEPRIIKLSRNLSILQYIVSWYSWKDLGGGAGFQVHVYIVCIKKLDECIVTFPFETQTRI